MEGELTLQVARRLAARLLALGAERADLVREATEPTTPIRPSELTDQSRALLAERGIRRPPNLYDGPLDPQKANSVLWNAEVLFTRADIRARARRVNDTLRPDLVVCLHFNAEKWGDPAAPELVPKNHLHLLVNGCYEPDEIARDDVRFEMLCGCSRAPVPRNSPPPSPSPGRWRPRPGCRRSGTPGRTRSTSAAAPSCGRATSSPTGSTAARWSIANPT